MRENKKIIRFFYFLILLHRQVGSDDGRMCEHFISYFKVLDESGEGLELSLV